MMDPISSQTLAASLVFLIIIISSLQPQGLRVEAAIGVNYGTVADDLPPPSDVAKFLTTSTVIDRIRLFDADPEILHAFSHTDIAVTVTVPNAIIPRLAKPSFAAEWVRINVQPYVPVTDIVRILVGNEVLSTANKLLIANLVPAMRNLNSALAGVGLDGRVKVTTPHSLGILSTSSPPSTGKFRQGYDVHVIGPLLGFLRETGSVFMVNPYPFFGCSEETLDYALFRENPGVVDGNSGLKYTNMLDAQLDAVYSALKALGFPDVDIAIAETGWPSEGDPAQVGVDPASAVEYNGNLIRHVNSNVGTPLMPNRTFETYVFALFNEDLKPGPKCERNFGLFRPNMTPVYDVGILRHTARSSEPTIPVQGPSPGPSPGPVSEGPISPSPPHEGKAGRFCMPKRSADPEALQRNIDFVCGLGLDCGPIQEYGLCFRPNTLRAHAAFAMNLYYHVMGMNGYDCDFEQTGAITDVDPSYGRCNY